MGRLPFLSPLLTTSSEEAKTDDADYDPQYDPNRVNVRGVRTRLRLVLRIAPIVCAFMIRYLM